MLSRTTTTATRTPPAGPATPTGSRPASPVEVRTEDRDGRGQPGQLLWRGRLWLVREAAPLVPAAGEAERWRVRAGSGPSGQPAVLDLVRLPTGAWLVGEGGA